jgi:hypothetical protein
LYRVHYIVRQLNWRQFTWLGVIKLRNTSAHPTCVRLVVLKDEKVLVEGCRGYDMPFTMGNLRGSSEAPQSSGAAATRLRVVNRRYGLMAHLGSMPQMGYKPGGCNGGAQRPPCQDELSDNSHLAVTLNPHFNLYDPYMLLPVILFCICVWD